MILRLLPVLVALAVSGCLRGNIHPVPAAEAEALARARGPVPQIPVPEMAAGVSDLSRSTARFGLAKVVAQLPAGQAAIHFPTGGLDVEGTLCNYRRESRRPLIWDGDNRLVGDWQSSLGLVVFETFDRLGYKMAGDPSNVFEGRDALGGADYLIGARILNLRGDFCHAHDSWDGAPLYVYSGALSMEVEWSVHDTLARDVVFKHRTAGNFRQNTPVADGVVATFHRAFGVAAERFAHTPGLQRLAVADVGLDAAMSERGDGKPVAKTRSIVSGRAAPRFDIQAIGPSVVTVRSATGHGSGFFVGKRGLVVTNAHVVGAARRVRLLTSYGLELDADVIERDGVRDVALLQTTVKVSNPLAIRTELPVVPEEVFAIGSPLSEHLRTTVTKGVVSAIRREERSGLQFIQSDAAISAGNSGGPLVDATGRVVGLSVAKFADPEAEGLGLFIPIGEALDRLGVKVGETAAGT